MREITLKIDTFENDEILEVPALLIDDKHAIYSFENEQNIWFAPFVKFENGNVYQENAPIIIGRSLDKSMAHFKQLEEKLKTMTLFDYFTTNEEVRSLDYDFDLTEK
jgi:hypothetical protein